MATRSLSQEEHEFCRLIVYDPGKRPNYELYQEACGKEHYSQESARVEASKMLKRPQVAAEIQRMRDELSEKSLWSRVDSINALKDVVKKPDKQSDVIQAVAQLNKMFGWDKQTIDHTSSDGSMTPKGIDASKLSTAALKELMEARASSEPE